MEYYKYMMRNFISTLRKMKPYINIENMERYMVLENKEWDFILKLADGIYKYEIENKLSDCFKNEIYPIIIDFVILKKKFKKIKAIKIEEYKLKILIEKLENLLIY